MPLSALFFERIILNNKIKTLKATAALQIFRNLQKLTEVEQDRDLLIEMVLRPIMHEFSSLTDYLKREVLDYIISDVELTFELIWRYFFNEASSDEITNNNQKQVLLAWDYLLSICEQHKRFELSRSWLGRKYSILRENAYYVPFYRSIPKAPPSSLPPTF